MPIETQTREVKVLKIDITVEIDEDRQKEVGQSLKRAAHELKLDGLVPELEQELDSAAEELGAKRLVKRKEESGKKPNTRRARKPKDPPAPAANPDPPEEPEKASLVGAETGEKPSPPPLPLASAEPPKGPMDDNDDSGDLTIEELASRGAEIESVEGLTPPPEPEDTGFSESE